MIEAILILVIFLIIGQSTYSRAIETIDNSGGRSEAGCGCAAGMVAIAALGAVTLAAMVMLMMGGS